MTNIRGDEMTRESPTNRKKSIKFMLWVSIILIVALIVFFLVTVVFSDSSDSDTTDEVGDDAALVEEVENSIAHNLIEDVAVYTNF